MGSTHQLLGDVRTKVAQDDSNGDGTAIRERLRRDPHPHPRSSVMRVAMLMRSSILDPHRETSRTWKRFVFFSAVSLVNQIHGLVPGFHT